MPNPRHGARIHRRNTTYPPPQLLTAAWPVLLPVPQLTARVTHHRLGGCLSSSALLSQHCLLSSRAVTMRRRRSRSRARHYFTTGALQCTRSSLVYRRVRVVDQPPRPDALRMPAALTSCTHPCRASWSRCTSTVVVRRTRISRHYPLRVEILIDARRCSGRRVRRRL